MSGSNINLAAVDINLLVALDALLEEAHVTRAAQKLGLSQSAMSHALSRLRELFEDPLLVRAGRSMVLTQKAQSLRQRVRQVLDSIEQIFANSDAFDAAKLRSTFRLRCSDLTEFLLLSGLDMILTREAPQVGVQTVPISGDYTSALRSGEVDFVCGVYADVPSDILLERLYVDRFVCMVRRGHPVLKSGLTLDAYISFPHILVAPRGHPGSYVDSILQQHGLERRIARTVAYFLTAPHLLVGSDAILTISERLAKCSSEPLGLEILEPPLPLGGYTMSCIWHERNADSPPHRWFRSVLQRAARRLDPSDTDMYARIPKGLEMLETPGVKRRPK